METVGKLAPLGFGFMRLPLKDADDPTSIDIDKVCELVDIFMDAGFTYFDSARGYHGCKSEWALRKALVERYPRDSFTIATKLPAWLAKDADEARAMFDTSLEECGIDYFDYYLLHNLGETLTPPFDEYGLWEFCAEKKAEGKIKKFGFSIHDNAEELERVLDAHPEVDFVQLQINYVDWESDIIQSRKCYEVCQERGLPVVIMEPVKGGTLVKLPEAVADVLRETEPGASIASWALRFAGSLPNVIAVLSGMNTPEMVAENAAIMRDGVPLTPPERRVYLMLNKPRGYVTTLSDERGRPTAAELVADCGTRVYPVGRLDLDSEGLLLFTNDGAWMQRILHPSHEIEKTYEVTVAGAVENAAAELAAVRSVDGEPIAPARVRLLRKGKETAELSVTIHEGKNRQIRRMCAAVGLHVKRLRRVREHTLSLGALPEGGWRELTADEVRAFEQEK